MKEQIIVITGKQGSGKTTMANKLADNLKYRRPYKNIMESAKVIEYDLSTHIPNEFCVIVVVQKELLVNALETIGERNYIIIDTDNK